MTPTHKCPVEGCRHTDVDQDRVMCWKHWGMVPRDLQNQVYRWAAMSKRRGRIQSEHLGRSQGWRLTPSEVAQALRSAAASGSYIAEPILRPAN